MEYAPRVWVGCLACYSEGSLNGEWIDAVDAEDVTVETLHPDPTDHEELWIFDHEYIPVSGEFSISTAAEWGEALKRCQDELQLPIEVLNEVIKDLSWTTPGEVDCDHLADIYCGAYEDFRDYAWRLADETMNIPEHLQGYFDLDQYERDLRLNGDFEVRYNGDSYIFSSV